MTRGGTRLLWAVIVFGGNKTVGVVVVIVVVGVVVSAKCGKTRIYGNIRRNFIGFGAIGSGSRVCEGCVVCIGGAGVGRSEMLVVIIVNVHIFVALTRCAVIGQNWGNISRNVNVLQAVVRLRLGIGGARACIGVGRVRRDTFATARGVDHGQSVRKLGCTKKTA